MVSPIHFQKQDLMRKVLLALSPACIGSIYFFGWRSAAVLALSVISAVLTEWLFVRKKKGKVSEAVFVTAFLFAMVLPPTIPFWMVVLGAAFALTFGKMAFGGFGANVFNPAMVGRAFLYITFPIAMTATWIPAANLGDFPGGFARWMVSSGSSGVSAITSATASHAYREGAQSLPDIWQLFVGSINGSFEKLGETVAIGGGSLGETSALLILIGGIFLLWKKTAKWRLILGFFSTYILMQVILRQFTPQVVPPLLYGLFSGGALFGGFFMVTDPVSAPKTKGGQWIYSSIIAIFTNIIRSYSLFAGGLMFSILLGNMSAPLIDLAVRRFGREKT